MSRLSAHTTGLDGGCRTNRGVRPSTVDFNQRLEEVQEPGQKPLIEPAAPALAKNLSFSLPPGLLGNVSMKEAGVVKGVWGVSPEVIAVLPGEVGRVKRRVGQGLAGARVVALDAAGRVWQWVRVRGLVEGGEQRSSLYRLIGV